MADSNASFIPKNSNRVKRRVNGTRRIYLLSYFSYVIFFGTLLTVLGTYFYAIQVTSQLDDMKAKLQVTSKQFATGDLNTVLAVEKKLIAANQLLDDTLAPSRLFRDIELVVAQNIQFTELEYEYLPNKTFQISLTGLASDFNQLLYQRDLMNSSPLLQNAEVVSYDYTIDSANGGFSSESSSSTISTSNSAVLSFVFEDILDGQVISYQPVAEPVLQVQSIITEVRGSDEVLQQGTGTTTSDVQASGNPLPDPAVTSDINNGTNI